MDSEVVAVDVHTGGLRSFQELSNRARKDVQLKDVKVAVRVYAFDLMYLDDEVGALNFSSHGQEMILSGPARANISKSTEFVTLEISAVQPGRSVLRTICAC